MGSIKIFAKTQNTRELNSNNSAFENLAFNPVNLGTILLSDITVPDENLCSESLAHLDTKYFFPETLPVYFQDNNKKSYI